MIFNQKGWFRAEPALFSFNSLSSFDDGFFSFFILVTIITKWKSKSCDAAVLILGNHSIRVSKCDADQLVVENSWINTYFRFLGSQVVSSWDGYCKHWPNVQIRVTYACFQTLHNLSRSTLNNFCKNTIIYFGVPGTTHLCDYSSAPFAGWSQLPAKISKKF